MRSLQFACHPVGVRVGSNGVKNPGVTKLTRIAVFSRLGVATFDVVQIEGLCFILPWNANVNGIECGFKPAPGAKGPQDQEGTQDDAGRNGGCERPTHSPHIFWTSRKSARLPNVKIRWWIKFHFRNPIAWVDDHQA